MDKIEIRNIRELNYRICTYLMRMRIGRANIYCADSTIMESLSLYMMMIGMPSNDGPFGSGFSLIKQTRNIMRGIPCIIITEDRELPALRNDELNGIAFILRDITREQIERLVPNIEDFDLDSVPVHLRNEEIRIMFLRAFMLAEENIYIISPWMSYTVINKALLDQMEKTILNGVKIHIIYGLKTTDADFNSERSEYSDRVKKSIVERLGQYGDAIKIERRNIHYKLVICDEKFLLEGSYNYLSFDGDYSKPNVRDEGSPFRRDVEYIRTVRKEYFGDGN